MVTLPNSHHDDEDGAKRNEQSRVLQVISDAVSTHHSSPPCILVIKSSSTTHLSCDSVYTKICQAVDLLSDESDPCGKWDIFYLCRWLDRCDLHQPSLACPDLVRTWSPFGLQAVMVSPSGARKLLHQGASKVSLDRTLNRMIEQDKLKAISYRHNLFDHTLVGASTDKDLAKLTLCRRAPRPAPPMISLEFYVVVVFFCLLVLSVAAWFSWRRTSMYGEDDDDGIL